MRRLAVATFVVACAGAVAVGVGLASRPAAAPPAPVAASADGAAVAATPAPSRRSTGETTAFLFSLPVPRDAWGSAARGPVDASREAFVGTGRLDAFFERGLRNPVDGGLFYARLAFRHCTQLRNATGGDEGTPLARARARCGSLGDAASRERLDNTLQTGGARLDPALAIVDSLDERIRTGRLTPVDVATALDGAIALGDPYVVRNVFLRGLVRVERFDGQPVDPQLRGDLMMASRLALCDLGIDCAQEARVLLGCGGRGDCPDALAAMGIGGTLSDEQRVRLSTLATRLLVAARDGSLPAMLR